MDGIEQQRVVPQFHPKWFRDSEGRAWTQCAGEESRAGKPEGTAVETNFCSPISSDGERLDDAGKTLSVTETAISPLWDEPMARRVMKGEEREKLAVRHGSTSRE